MECIELIPRYHVEILESVYDLLMRGVSSVNQIEVDGQWYLYNMVLIPGLCDITIVKIPKKITAKFLNISPDNSAVIPANVGVPVINVKACSYVEETIRNNYVLRYE